MALSPGRMVLVVLLSSLSIIILCTLQLDLRVTTVGIMTKEDLAHIANQIGAACVKGSNNMVEI